MTCRFNDVEKLSTYLSCRKTLLGKGAIQSAGPEARKMGCRKALVVTDAGVVKAGLVKPLADSFAAEGLALDVFDKVLPEPPAAIVDQAAEQARQGDYDLVVGLGGGSSLDAAKATALLAVNPGSVLDYVGMDLVPKRGLPTIMVPTTAGTGSETTRVLVITDQATNSKKVVYSDFMLPDLAILDPALTVSVPPAVTADTGLDALVHAIETVVSMNTTPYAQILGLQAIRLIAHNLPQAYAKGGNLNARYNMLLAANLAGGAFASGGLGAVHGLAYVLGTEYHMSHGRSNAIMLPHVMSYNLIGNPDQYAAIAEAMGQDVDGLPPLEAAEMAVAAVKELMVSMGVSYRLPDYGVSRQDMPKLVQGGLAQARLFVPNPRDLNEAQVEEVYAMAF